MNQVELQMRVLEKNFAINLKYLLGAQYLSTARFVEIGVYNVEHIESYRSRFEKLMSFHYKRVASTFHKLAKDKLEEQKMFDLFPEIKETTMDAFWTAIALWIKEQTAQSVTQVNTTTKSLLKLIIERGMLEGKSDREIAKEIRAIKSISNNYRAMTIAMTETHAAAVNSIHESVKSTGLASDKEWMTAGDERVRDTPFSHVAADKERVPMDAKFVMTGEELDYPGDPNASGSNRIRCRCVILYFMLRKMVILYQIKRMKELHMRGVI